jgi:hypothetical protein
VAPGVRNSRTSSASFSGDAAERLVDRLPEVRQRPCAGNAIGYRHETVRTIDTNEERWGPPDAEPVCFPQVLTYLVRRLPIEADAERADIQPKVRCARRESWLVDVLGILEEAVMELPEPSLPVGAL